MAASRLAVAATVISRRANQSRNCKSGYEKINLRVGAGALGLAAAVVNGNKSCLSISRWAQKVYKYQCNSQIAWFTEVERFGVQVSVCVCVALERVLEYQGYLYESSVWSSLLYLEFPMFYHRHVNPHCYHDNVETKFVREIHDKISLIQVIWNSRMTDDI